MNLITTPAQVGYTPVATAIVHSTTASLTSRAPVQPVHLVQYDQTMPVIAVALTANGQPYTVPSGAAVNVRMDKPDGTHVYDPALGVSTNGQTAYIGITAQMTAAAGSSSPIVEIVVNEGVAGTAAFPVIIDPNPVPDSAYESTDEYLTLYEILQQAQSAAQIVQQNAQNLQNVTDNLEAIQNAAANAQAAAQSAQEAQTAAQQALGFRTFFSAVSPDENGDLDPSRPMTTPTAQASWTIKSRGDRIQSVQIDGFTTQSGTGDPSPDNVRPISTAGLRMLALVLNGTENWALRSSGSNGAQFEMPLADAPIAGTNQTLAAQTQKCSVCIVNNADNYPGDCAWAFSTGGQSRLRVRMFRATTVDVLKQELSSRYAAGTPVVFWYVPDDESQATGLYVPIQSQGHEYRCQMLELTEPLCNGDKVESNVPSGCDKKLILTGTESFSLAKSPGNVFQNFNLLTNSENFTAVCNDYTIGGNSWSGMPDKSVLNSSNILGFRDTDFATVKDFKATLAARYAAGNPVVVWYRSTAYTEANDIPVELEAHQQRMLVLDGTNYIGAAGAVDKTGFYCFLSNMTLDSVASYNNNAVCSHFKNAKVQLGTAFPENQLNSFCVANNQYGLRFAIAHATLGTTPQSSVEDCSAAVKEYFAAQYAAGTPVTIVYPLASPAIYDHDPVELIAMPYTEADATTANQLAATPSTLPYFDSADVPMLLDSIGMPEPDVTVQSYGTLDAENTQKAAEWVQETAQRLMAAPLASALPVAGTYVVSSQDGTTVLVSLKAMQDGGDAATLEGMTLDDIKALISSMIADANK